MPSVHGYPHRHRLCLAHTPTIHSDNQTHETHMLSFKHICHTCRAAFWAGLLGLLLEAHSRAVRNRKEPTCRHRGVLLKPDKLVLRVMSDKLVLRVMSTAVRSVDDEGRW